MDKVSKILKQKKGMTLIETVVAFIIAGILIAVTSALIIAGLNLYQDTAAKKLDKQIGDSVLEIARNELQYAKSITKGPATPTINLSDYGTSGAIFIGTNDITPGEQGELYRKEANATDKFEAVYPDSGFYSNRQIQLQLTIDQANTYPKAVTLNVKVMDGSDVKYNRSTSFQLLNSTFSDEPLAAGAWPATTVIKFVSID